MRNIVFAATMLISILCWDSSHAGDADAGKPDSAEIAATINKLMSQLTQTAETLDAEKTLAPLTQDKDAVFFFDSRPYTLKELTHALRGMYGNLKSMSIKMDKTYVKVLGNNAAVWIACGKGKSVDKTGQLFEEYLTETWIWQKTEGPWQVVHYHESVVSLPNAEKKRDIEKSLLPFAADLQEIPPTAEGIYTHIENYLSKNPGVVGAAFALSPELGKKSSFYVFRKTGGGFEKRGSPTSYDYSTADWYAKSAASGKTEWCEPYYDIDGAGLFMVTCSMPVYNKQHHLMGVITADLGL
ncbi:MAG: nuclear transport factor 2 family protein [Kiritimatiellae bacterium]|nr:nuclear transport factor 2 family protein [Kiritimatiellia bacterium]